MDFFQFLQNSNNKTDVIKDQIKDEQIKHDQFKNDSTKENIIKENIIKENIINEDVNNINSLDTYKNLRKGNFVTIIYNKDSNLNCYKGYFGEVKDYKKTQDYALIFLHACNNCSIIKFPLTHFILHDN